MSGRRAGLAGTLALVLAALLAPPAAAGSGTVRMVDDDGRAAPGRCNASATAATSIQDAVDAASPGDTIVVCPGIYREFVAVAGIDDLVIRSAVPWKATIQPLPSQNPEGAPALVAILDADDITFQGFRVIRRTGGSCNGAFVGILAVGARDAVIRGNRVRAFGDTLSECGVLVGIMAGFPFGPFITSGAGVEPEPVLDDLTTTATIAYNAVRDHAFIGIAAVSTVFEEVVPGGEPTLITGPTRADVRNNSVRYFHLGAAADACSGFPFFLFGTTAERRAARAFVQDPGPAGPGGICPAVGIYQGAGTGDSPIPGAAGVISRNRVLSGPDAGFLAGGDVQPTPAQLVGILVVDQKHTPGASVVRDNLVFRNLAGIIATDARNVRIADNRARDNGFGVGVWDTVGATVRGNRVLDNIVGIVARDQSFITSTSAGDVPSYLRTRDVVFRQNDARDNLDVSCADETVGDGTRGTANTWTGNDGEPGSSEPDGICGPEVP